MDEENPHIFPEDGDDMDDPSFYLESPMWQAVRTGNLERVRELINKYDINAPDYNDWTLIHESALSDDLSDVFQYLISAGAKIQFEREGCVSPLYVACRHGSLKIATMLVEAGCEVNERCLFDYEFSVYAPTNFTPLHVACIGNHKDMVAFLIGKNADVNAKDCEGRTPTYYALREKNVDILSLLIDAGADLVTEDIYGDNIMHHACGAHFDPETFSLLGAYGLPFINNRSISGRTALMDASSKGYCALAEELIKLGADVTLTDNDGLLALHMAALSGYDIFKLLLQHTPADAIERCCTFNACSEKWRSLPCCVIESLDFKSLVLLYSSGLSEAVLSCPDKVNDVLLSPVSFVLTSHYFLLFKDECMDYLKFLLSFEFLVDPAYETVGEISQDDNKFGKKTRLKQLKPVEAVIYIHQLIFDEWDHHDFDDWNYICCCMLYLSEILSHSPSNHNKMLPYGYSNGQLNFFTDSALYVFFDILELLKYAEFVNSYDVMKEFLKGLISDPSAPLKYISDPSAPLKYNPEKIFKFLLKMCGNNFMTTFFDDMNDPKLYLDSPMRQAVKTGHLARVRELINKYDINAPNYKNWTLIHESVVSDDFSDVFQYLISAGAKIQFKTEGGVSPLYVACRHGSLKIATMLVEAGCEVNERCLFDYEFSLNVPKNFTPLHVACIGNHKDMVAFLIEKNADVNAKDCEGRTPTYYALREKNVDILSLLIDAGADLVTEDIYGDNIMHHACGALFNPKTFSVLQAYGLPFINNRSISGRTALMNASSKGNRILADMLIKLGADVTLADNDGLLALHMAALSGYDIFKLLLQHTPADTIEKCCTFNSCSEKWRSLPCCVIENHNFESLKLLYCSGLSEAVLSCPDRVNDLLLSPLAFFLMSEYFQHYAWAANKFVTLLLSYEFQVNPAYETVGEISEDDYKFGKKTRLKQLKPVEAVIYRHRRCIDCCFYMYSCSCNFYLSLILSHSSIDHNKMLPDGYSRQLKFFTYSARYGFFETLELLKYAEDVNANDVLKEYLTGLSNPSDLSNPFLDFEMLKEEVVSKFLLEMCDTNLMTTFLEMKTLASENLSFDRELRLTRNVRLKYKALLKICKLAESYHSAATLEKMCRLSVRKYIQRKSKESMLSFQECMESMPLPPMLNKLIRYDISLL